MSRIKLSLHVDMNLDLKRILNHIKVVSEQEIEVSSSRYNHHLGPINTHIYIIGYILLIKYNITDDRIHGKENQLNKMKILLLIQI